MGDDAALDTALEQVVTAARAHLRAIRAAGGALDDRQVWDSYLALNNASAEYDQLLLDRFGEVTPWATEVVHPAPEPQSGPSTPPVGGADPYPAVVAVRQRRDYRVPSVAGLLAAAGQATARMRPGSERSGPESVGEAVLALVRDTGGGSGGLDLPELHPLGGVVTVSETARPLPLAGDGGDSGDVFTPATDELEIARVAEQPDPSHQPGAASPEPGDTTRLGG